MVFKKIRRLVRRIKKSVVLLYPVLPSNIRWNIANKHHQEYKLRMLKKHGEKEYFLLYDYKAVYDLQRYGVGIHFEDKVVLDIGCGLRGVLGIIKAKEKIGVDPSLTPKVLRSFNMPKDITFLCEKAEKMSIETNYVDAVFCINTLNHVDDIEQVLKEIKRVLKPKGLFLLDMYLEPYALGHTHEFNRKDVGFLHLTVEKYFKTKYIQVLPRMKHELTGELVNPRWGGVFEC